MARYDRIARLDPPPRDAAFTGWLALRDLQDRERDTDLGRRARLRFLAVRLIHRLSRQGDGIDRESLKQQCNSVREELGQLSGRDPERQRLAEFLKEVATLDPRAIVESALEMADTLSDEEQRFAAEECYRAAIDLAQAHDLDELRAAGLRGLTSLDASSPQA